MTRVLALARRDLSAGKTRAIKYTAAHGLSHDQERDIQNLLIAQAVWSQQLRLHEVPSHTLAAVTAIVSGDTGAAPSSPAVIRQTPNALADWGAKQVTVAGQAASTALTPNWLSPYEWTLVADNGAIQHADTRSIAELINRRVGEVRMLVPIPPQGSTHRTCGSRRAPTSSSDQSPLLRWQRRGQCQRSALPGTTAR
jgi:hypothetical protein